MRGGTPTGAATAEKRPAMAIMLRDKPPGYSWGWFSNEEPRMHLQTVDDVHRHLHYKVWLETKGKRVFEPGPGIPARVLKTLRQELERSRGFVEIQWIKFMIRNRWLTYRVNGTVISLYAYPKTPSRFERTIDLLQAVPDEELARSIKPGDVAMNKVDGMLELFAKRHESERNHIPLENVLWTD